MKASCLFFERNIYRSKRGQTIVVALELYEISDKNEAAKFPDGYRFSWIAFNQDDPEQKVLFDCHPPKGPHFHIDQDKVGKSFLWTSLDDAIKLFNQMVEAHFGELE